jgi:predicted anti-sigma-YlaC factor YlaD
MKSCKDITELIEKEKVVGISFREKIQVKAHLMMCKLCKNFAKDSEYLDRLLRKLKAKSFTLTVEERAKIKKDLG